MRMPLIQYAYFVDDLGAACLHWVECFGAGPFFVSFHHKSENVTYRGAPSDPDISYAFGQAGPAQIQLVQQHDDTPSCYLDMFPDRKEGLHHVAVFVQEYEKEKERFMNYGYELVTELVSGARVAYVDARKDLGCFVELYEDNPRTRKRFAGWERDHREWDGVTDPIRQLYDHNYD